MIQKSAAQLAEHYDSVQIFVTRQEFGEKNGTIQAAYGVGNFYSRYGQVKEWIAIQDEGARERVRQEYEKD